VVRKLSDGLQIFIIEITAFLTFETFGQIGLIHGQLEFVVTEGSTLEAKGVSTRKHNKAVILLQTFLAAALFGVLACFVAH
jgi:hypothetical protein